MEIVMTGYLGFYVQVDISWDAHIEFMYKRMR